MPDDKFKAPLPIPVRRALRKLGADMKDARRRRRIPMALMSERANISRTTLTKIEKGDASVSMGSYAKVLFVLGIIGSLQDIADTKNDTTGLILMDESLPKRIYLPRRSKEKSNAEP